LHFELSRGKTSVVNDGLMGALQLLVSG